LEIDCKAGGKFGKVVGNKDGKGNEFKLMVVGGAEGADAVNDVEEEDVKGTNGANDVAGGGIVVGTADIGTSGSVGCSCDAANDDVDDDDDDDDESGDDDDSGCICGNDELFKGAIIKGGDKEPVDNAEEKDDEEE
jgi:hypothetical protein